MPELPEVETVRAGLARAALGGRIRAVRLNRPDLRYPFPEKFDRRLAGARILEAGRRGKYITLALSTGETLIVHLGMSGRIVIALADAAARPGRFVRAAGADPAHDHVVIDLEDAAGGPVTITYNDARRFGFMDLAETGRLGECRHFSSMGPEPLGPAFTDAALLSALKRRRGPVKTALLDQRVVAGLGNIYVCEALFRARIAPRRAANRIAAPRVAALRSAIVAVLNEAVAAGGTTLRDFANAEGGLGYFQHGLDVYGREGAPCPACGGPVRRSVLAARATFHCPRCQR